jgi:hypothetical protein
MKKLSSVYKNENGFCFNCQWDEGQLIDIELIYAQKRCGINPSFINMVQTGKSTVVSGSDRMMVETFYKYLVYQMGWNQYSDAKNEIV